MINADKIENRTLTFAILEKIKTREFVKGKTITEIAIELGTTRNLMQSIIHKILKYQDILEFDEIVEEISHYKKKNLKKYKNFYVFKGKNFYVVVDKKSETFKELMGI